jgi:hypothetical protein
MKSVLEQWKTTMEICGLAVGSTDDTVVRELREALGMDEELAGWYREEPRGWVSWILAEIQFNCTSRRN